MSKIDWQNGLISEYLDCPHTGEVAHRLHQPNADLILERNKKLRNEPEAFDRVKKKSMEQVASIPLLMWEKAIRDGYDLNCPDKDIADKELMRYLRSYEGMACLVTNKKV